MTQFYKDKMRCFRMIDELLAAQTPVEKIYFKVETMFGFGHKIVNERIKTLKDVAKINDKNGN